MKKKLLLVILLTLTLVGIPVVKAKDDTGFYADDKVTVKEDKNRTIFATGETVQLKSMIDGSSFVAGRKLTINSSQDNIFAAGEKINIESAGSKEAFVAGETIEIKNTELRDVFLAGNNITVEESKARDAYIAASTVILDSTFEGNVTVAAEKLVITENAIITGVLKYSDETETDISKEATISKIHKYKQPKNENIMENNMYIDLLVASLTMILISLIILSTNKKVFKEVELAKKDATTIINILIKGLAILILVPVAGIILIDTVIGTPIGIILLLVYGILFYLSAIPTAYYLGKWILGNKIKDNYQLIAISIFALYVLRMIPVVGPFVTLTSLLLGLGLFGTVLINLVKSQEEQPSKEEKVQEAVIEEEPKKKETSKKANTKTNNLKDSSTKTKSNIKKK